MKFLLKFFAVFGFLSSVQLFGAYTDEFGPLQSYYTMGDFVRYTVTPGLNIYSGIVTVPYAQDIKTYVKNVGNLYNTVGYLYAGYAALNIYPTWSVLNNWTSSFRKSGMGTNPDGSLTVFDNNFGCAAAIQLVDEGRNYGWMGVERSFKLANDVSIPFSSTPYPNFYLNSFAQPVNIAKPSSVDGADASCGTVSGISYTAGGSLPGSISTCTWNANWPGGYLLFDQTPIAGSSNYPVKAYGQFFGARIAHILGAVTNDVSASTASSGPTIATESPMPQLALMKGGYTTANAPAGSVTPSTAHFGTIANFLNSLEPAVVQQYPYLQSHLLPTVTRLASLFSYEISMDEATQNLIKIKSSNENVSYDNGVIVQIQNNTGDTLQINQISSGGSITIGSLNTDQNNYFLHTASLMADGAPTSGNMIELQDLTAKSSIFIQVASSSDLKTLLSAVNSQINSLAGQTSLSLAYNQHDQTEYEQLNAAAYVVLTNFNPTALSSDEDTFLMYRVQVINIAEFFSNPYFLTLQINKEQVGVGIQPTTPATVENPNPPAYGSAQNLFVWGGATEDTFVLYPSILSVKVFSWKNLYNNAVGSYSKMPLLLMPESIIQANIKGLQAHYGIWLTSYTAALTEFSFGGAVFGDNFGYLNTNFGIFENSPNPVEPSRVVIDSSVLLQSGNTVNLSQPAITLMGSDVWDYGNLCVPNYYNFHQDIPVLHLYQNKQTQAIEANQAGGAYINFAVTFGSANLSSDLFGSKYGRPFENIMLFSLPTQDMQVGVTGELLQLAVGDYQLLFKDQIGNVLAVGKVFNVTNSPITVEFLNSNNNAAWNSLTQLPADIASVSVGKKAKFMLQVNTSQSKYSLKVLKYLKPTSLSTIQNKKYNDVKHAMATTVDQVSVYDATLKEGDIPEYISFSIGSRAGLAMFKNLWGANSLAPDMSSIFKNISWQVGLTLMLVGLDQDGNVLSSLTGVAPASFYLMAFYTDAKDTLGYNLGGVEISVSDLTTNVAKFSDKNAWSNFITIDYAGKQTIANVQYPFALTIEESEFGNYDKLRGIFQSGNIDINNSEIKLADGNLVNGQSIPSPSQLPTDWTFIMNNSWASLQQFISNLNFLNKNSNWDTGVSFVFVALDADENIIYDLSKTPVSKFYLIAYDTKTGVKWGQTPLLIDSSYQYANGWKTSSLVGGNLIWWRYTDDFNQYDPVDVINTQNYPCVITLSKTGNVSVSTMQIPDQRAAAKAVVAKARSALASVKAAQKAAAKVAAAKAAEQKAAAEAAAAKVAAEKLSQKSFTVSKIASKDYATLSAELKKRDKELSQIDAYDSSLIDGTVPDYQDFGGMGGPVLSNTPTSFNFNIGTRAGIMFFKNVWTAQTTESVDTGGFGGMQEETVSTPLTAVAPDITTILGKGTWANGISMVLLGIDQFGRVIMDMTKLDPVSFHLMVYDAKTGKNLGDVAIPMSDATRNAAGFADTNSWSNAIAVGGFATITPATAQYPVVLTVSNQQPALKVKKAAVKKVAPQTQAQIAAKAAAKTAAQKISKKSFAIADVESKNYQVLYEKLKTAGKSLDEIQISDTSLQDQDATTHETVEISDATVNLENLISSSMPYSFNINMGKRAQFFFFSSNMGLLNRVGGMTDLLENGSWTRGMSLVVVGIDEFGNVILDMTQLDPASFYLLVYDTKTGNYLGGQPFTIANAITNSGDFSDKNPWINTITVGGFGSHSIDETGVVVMNPKDATVTYPMVLTISNHPKVSIKPLEKTVQKTEKPVVQPVAKTKTKEKAKENVPATPVKTDIKKEKTTAPVVAQTYLSLQKVATYSDLAKQIQLMPEHEVQYPAITPQTRPLTIILGIDYLGYIFFQDFSNMAKFVAEFAADLNSKLNWANGVRFVLLGFDKASQLITDATFTKQIPLYFAVFLYDGVTGEFLGSQPLEISQMYQIPIDGMKCVVDTVQALGSYPSSFMIKSAVIKK